MTTEEKKPEIKLKKLGEPLNSKERYDILGLNEMKEEEKDSFKSKSDEENKEIINLNISSQEKNTNSKIIKEKSEEFENNNNSNQSNNSENQSQSQSSKSNKSGDNEEKKINEKNSGEISEENAKENKDNDNSSFLDSKHYKNIKVSDNEELEESSEEKSGKNLLKRNDPFMTTGKFMQIQPHFNLFNKRIDILREGIYDNTKKCLMCKSSLQMSENLMRERANSIVRDFVEKLYNLKELFMSSNTDADNIMNETRKGIMNLENVQKINKNEIKDCDYRLNRCERQIGYKLLGKPNYSFMKRVCNTTFNKK